MFTTDEIIDAIRTGYIPPDPGRLGEFGRVLEALGERRSTEAVVVHPKVLTAAEVAEIRAREKNTTHGWELRSQDNTADTTVEYFVLAQGIPMHGRYRDCLFVVHSRADVPALCDSIEALRAQLDRILGLIAGMEHEDDCSLHAGRRVACNCIKSQIEMTR